jgi:hypothetical protein
MADSAVIEVEMDVCVRVKVEAEGATVEELRRFVERDPEGVRGAICSAIDHHRTDVRLSESVRLSPSSVMFVEKEAGWLDEDRCVFVTEVIEAEPKWYPRSGTGMRAIKADPVVVR